MTAHLDPTLPSGYVIDAARRFDPDPVIGRALTLTPGVRIGVEEIGWGWTVNTVFADGLLNGRQKQVRVADLGDAPATRVAVHGSGIVLHLEALAATGVTVTPAGADWADITAPGTSKATALERLRARMGVPPEATVAVGDGMNDLDMLRWAGRSYAMGHAPTVVQAVADEVTGTIQEHGAVAVLRSLLPVDIGTAPMSHLAAQLAIATHTAPGHAVVVRVRHGSRADLTHCEVWTLQGDTWERHAPVPAGTGATMRNVEAAAREANLVYPRGDEGRRRAHWRTSVPNIGPAAFELPLSR
ncbi:HAD family hydrolase [Promicromonospora iranensis]|uniref:Hydroxymethylpyrimidine pyrophosphatase-like HAD family hydrolase n=1 Tax=Promicromonospora iranensis TaxID=1105144 RepID=A0ABU2CHM2_9MICO|nr:HAD hydrolase family protein [Promicromonospora iranensis]MDR7380834.1 hypothetical protein [Promicromonospora iranensis]